MYVKHNMRAGVSNAKASWLETPWFPTLNKWHTYDIGDFLAKRRCTLANKSHIPLILLMATTVSVNVIYKVRYVSLQWRHDELDGVTNYHDRFTQLFIHALIKEKHQSSASLAVVRGIHRWPVNSPHKGPVTRKMFPNEKWRHHGVSY